MRKDMSKVIVERPRTGRAAGDLRPGRTRAVMDDDGEPLRTRAPLKGDRERRSKRLNETLNPLKRYLGKQIGRPWDKVFSEIAENLKVTSTVQQHVRDHIEDFVAIRTRMKAGKVIAAAHLWGGERALEDDYRRYYVHPRTGLLRENPNWGGWNARHRAKRAAEDAELATRMREIDARTQAHKLKDDVWWEVRLGKASDREPDVVLAAGLTTLAPEKLYGRHNVRAIAKRVLNKSEKKKLGL